MNALHACMKEIACKIAKSSAILIDLHYIPFEN